jgi:hypothetical protein
MLRYVNLLGKLTDLWVKSAMLMGIISKEVLEYHVQLSVLCVGIAYKF